MAKKKEQPISGDKRLENIEETLSNTEQFIINNQKNISMVVAIIVIVILAYFAFNKYYIEPNTQDAQEQLFAAQAFFEADSLDKALYGDGNSLGFLDIADEFSMTTPGNLANYYAGISFLRKGDFDQAIEFLNSFDSDDHVVSSMATGAIGDAYIEKGDNSKAIAYYLEAANKEDNSFTTPLFLFKAAQVYEINDEFEDAVRIYTRIKKNYATSTEGRSIDKYIARAESRLKK
ncbi:MAG: tetratricopeptide repeat protein [Bacteroidetes bacterium]|nr:MAG: tetratricopeptide repeat protein [Bacteroidota bacterium]